jgi:hypothetical protein
MADNSTEPDSPDPFSASSPSAEEGAPPPWEAEDVPMSDQPAGDEMSPSFALDMARLWVQKHQKASMLGAFAVGVFIGAMLPD